MIRPMTNVWDKTFFVGQRAYSTVGRQPGWIYRAAIATFVIAIMVPILLFIFLALFAAALVFGGLAVVNSIVRSLRSMRANLFAPRGMAATDRSGRRNVRVLGADKASA